MPAGEYFAANDFDSRTFFCIVAEHGGVAQEYLDEGHQWFTGNSATDKGNAFDSLVCGICEGKSFADIVQVPPDNVLASNGSRRGKAYDEWRLQARAKGIVDVNAEDAWRLERMLARLMANPKARRLVEETTETQVSVFFELNGHRIKVRPDACTPTLWWDLKTTSAKWERLFNSVLDFGYDAQEWLYVQAAMALGYDEFRMPFVFVQTTPPFACEVLYIPQELVKRAGLRMTRVMEEVRLRRETGVYEPADSGEIKEIVFPQWAMRKEEEEAITV